MAILVLLVLLWTSYVVTRLLRAQHVSSTAHSPKAGATPSDVEPGTGSQDGPAWSALDDYQLTRLLTESAPRTITE
jgi:hypothetical protein